jgi:hypothetical protein
MLITRTAARLSVVSAVVVTALLAALAPASAVPAAVPAAPAATASVGSASAVLASLTVAPERRAGYNRALFRHWVDADGDGCDTRREVIISEAAVAPTVGSGCFITRGSWTSVYDGVQATNYPSRFDVDHLVALAEAWDSGAWGWDAQRREAFANDLEHPQSLILVTAASNRGKSDKDPAQWLPSASAARCGYVGDWIRVKATWGLSVDAREARALAAALVGCTGDETLVTG